MKMYIEIKPEEKLTKDLVAELAPWAMCYEPFEGGFLAFSAVEDWIVWGGDEK